jgi:sorting nexin-29
LSYRGITLAPCAYKLYCSILNNRLVTWLDTRDIIHDEQNGFRKSKSTIDHLSTLTSIIETRKRRKLSTFAVFVDFKKAYDTVNKSLLFRDLNDLGISTKFLNTINTIYSQVECAIKLNGNMTEWFNVNSGLKQGCVLSPVLFNIFINGAVAIIRQSDSPIVRRSDSPTVRQSDKCFKLMKVLKNNLAKMIYS